MRVGDWIGLVQIVLTLVVVYFAYRTVLIASETLRAAKREQRLARLERMRTVVGDIERLRRWGGTPPEKERKKEQLTTLLGSTRAASSLPETSKLAHWHPSFEGADDVMETARLELNAAIDELFEQA